MYFVKALTMGPKDHAPVDPVRRDRLPLKRDGEGNLVRVDESPVGLWRQVERSPYWARMARDGDIALSENPPEEECEGYEPPAPKPAKADPQPKGE